MATRANWDYTYLVGYYDKQGELIISTYHNESKEVNFVVTGTDRPPLWNSVVPREAKVFIVPDNVSPQDYAIELSGLYAFGFIISDKIDRQ